VVAEHAYDYDPNNNRAIDTSRLADADNPGTYLQRESTFTYDPRDRLADVIRTDPATGQQVSSETYQHDANNNVINQAIDGVTTTQVYDRNRLQSATVDGIVSTYNYDPYGRLDTVTRDGQITQLYAYDGFDRITEQQQDGVITRKTYDALDRTTSQVDSADTADEKTTEYTYLGLTEQLLAEHVDGQLTTSYQHSAAGTLLSQGKHDPDTGTEEDSYYAYNPHGDVVALTDDEGNTRATYGYTAYGEDDDTLFTGVDAPDPTDPDQQPYNTYRYAGQRFDPATDTYDMGFRDYDPGLNRFLTRDMYNGALGDMGLTTNPWTMSRYTFAGGNPISLVEIDGHRPAFVDGGGGGGGVAPTCSMDTTPEYCHAPGENTIGAYFLGVVWTLEEWIGFTECIPKLTCGEGGPGEPTLNIYYRDGDPLTEGLRRNQHIQDARLEIAALLSAGRTSGEFNMHYSAFSADERRQTAWDNLDSVLTFGLAGMELERAFLGSYDLSWNVVGYSGGDPVVEFYACNGSYLNSASLDTGKVQNYGEGSACDGHDAFEGENWVQQSFRWRETFVDDRAPAVETWQPNSIVDAIKPSRWIKPIVEPLLRLF
jgi:RHS repeat-associated protein